MDDFARAAFREREARAVLRRRHFLVHLAVWAVTNLFLVVVWAVTGGGFLWWVFPLFGWGIGVVAHGVSAYLLSDPADVVLEREQRRMARGEGAPPT